MKTGKQVVTICMLIIVTITGTACSRLFGPSDQDVLKAINDSGLLKSQGFTVTAPPEIIEKGSKTQDGSWPVKVKLSLSIKPVEGAPKQIVTTPTFYVSKSKDSAGNTVWIARVGS